MDLANNVLNSSYGNTTGDDSMRFCASAGVILVRLQHAAREHGGAWTKPHDASEKSAENRLHMDAG